MDAWADPLAGEDEWPGRVDGGGRVEGAEGGVVFIFESEDGRDSRRGEGGEGGEGPVDFFGGEVCGVAGLEGDGVVLVD